MEQIGAGWGGGGGGYPPANNLSLGPTQSNQRASSLDLVRSIHFREKTNLFIELLYCLSFSFPLERAIKTLLTTTKRINLVSPRFTLAHVFFRSRSYRRQDAENRSQFRRKLFRSDAKLLFLFTIDNKQNLSYTYFCCYYCNI